MSRTLAALYEDLAALAELHPDSILVGLWDYELIVGKALLVQGPPSLDVALCTNPCATYNDIPLLIDFQKPYAKPEGVFAHEKEQA